MNLASRKNMPAVLGPVHIKDHQKPMTKGILLFLTLLSLPLLNACSQNSAQQKTLPPSEEAPKADSFFNEGKIEKLLNAEFTLQREGPNKAFEPFYELASQSGDISLIERLTHIAVVSQNPIYIERSANLWLSAAPTSETAYSLKLQILIKGNRAEEVTTLLTNAIRHKVSLRFLPLYLEDNVRDSDQVNTIEDAISALPPESKNNQHIQLSYAHLLLLSGKYQLAIDTSEKLLTKANTNKNEALYLILAFSQKNLGLTNDAIKTLQTASKYFPNNTRVITPLIDFLVENEQATLASEIYQKTDLDTPEKLQVGINLMRSLLEHNQPGLALTTAHSLPEEQLGLSDQIQYLTAIALAQLDKKTQAIELIKEVEGALQTNATNQMALWFYDQGKENDINAMVLNRTPRESMPEQVAAISRLHEEKGNNNLSFELVRDALVALPESDALRYHKALLADTLGNWKITETELKTLLQKDPGNPQYLNALGYTLLTRTNRIDEAMKYIESAYEKADNDPAIIDSLGWGFFLKGELEQSSYYLKKAWSILPDAEIAAHYGESLWKQRHYKEAIAVWEAALEASPDTPLLLDTIKRLSPSLLEEQKQDKPS
ncbi:MAG: tetratricopeptide repeat protein [Gammaproteobacteria bacterium]|nr:tetratricopeptide repeat protein [Gammaproteobacteria bacterium]